MEGTRAKAYTALHSYQKIRTTIEDPASDIFLLMDDGKLLDHYVWSPIFNNMVDHSDWYDLQIMPHSLQISGVTVCHQNGKDKMEIYQLGRWNDDTIFKYLGMDLITSPNKLRKVPAYKRVRQEVLHYFCNCRVVGNNPGGNARDPKYNMVSNCTDTAHLSNRHKLLVCPRHRGHRIKATRAHASITPKLCSMHAFVKHNLKAIPYMAPHIIDQQHISEKYQGDNLWFSVAVWLAKQCWEWKDPNHTANNTTPLTCN